MKKPPSEGIITLDLNESPVSLQAKAERRKLLKDKIQEKIAGVEYLLSGDIKVSITWFIHEQKRYETSHTADIDNIIKPILDSLCGRSGVMIDDNQIQRVTSEWFDTKSPEEERLEININFQPDEFLPKEELFFVHIRNNLYLPLWENLPKKCQQEIITQYSNMLKLRDSLQDAGMEYYRSSCFLPAQRVFHKNRLGEFTLKEIDQV